MKMRTGILLSIAISLALAVGCGRDDRASDALTGGCVVTAHPLATAAAADVLREGGGAVDAAVAAAFALAVVEPYSSGLGGGGFFVVHDAQTDLQLTLDAREVAPAAADRDMFLRDGVAVPALSRDGALSVAVPSLVRGLEELHRERGRLPWERLVAPAVALAREGFPVDAELAERIAKHAPRFDAAATVIFLPGGRTPAVGETLVQADLAATLEGIAAEGAAGFHEGRTAELMAAAVQDAGGLLTVDDLAAIRPVWREPQRGSFGPWTIVGMPLPSSGGMLLQQILALAEPWDLVSRPAAERLHLTAEAMKIAFADRARWLGDPDQVGDPTAVLLDPARLDSLRALVRPETAYPEHRLAGAEAAPRESDDTSHLSVVDADGNAVAATLTVNLSFGSGMVAAGTGVVLNDEMDDFSAAPGAPNYFGLVGGEANAVAPGKRPLSSMTPTIVLGASGVRLVAGSPGGSRIITATLQTVLDVLVLDMEPAASLAAPRIHHQWTPAKLFTETEVPMDVGIIDDLAARGHVMATRKSVGNVQLIVVDPETRTPVGAADPRGQGKALFIPRGTDGP